MNFGINKIAGDFPIFIIRYEDLLKSKIKYLLTKL